MNYAVILAGGSGTRLWPLSRRGRSKQSIKLVGDRTMFQHAVDRLLPLYPLDHIFVVTRQDQSSLLASQVPELPAANFINEPVGRGTAPAIGLAAILFQQKDPQAVMAVLTADHYIADAGQLRHALEASIPLARGGYLLTLGIKPTSPSTAFGYIQQDSCSGTVQDLKFFRVIRFTEKPPAEVAQSMVASGLYSWNSGMFIWRVDRILEEFNVQMPELYGQLVEAKNILGKPNAQEEFSRLWEQVTEQTIDYGIMEHAKDVLVIPIDVGWTDVGNWSSLSDLLPQDQNGNIFVGPYEAIDTHNTFVFGGKRLVATIGLDDIVIVDSEDALLVCAKNREQEVRQIVQQLKTKGENQWL